MVAGFIQIAFWVGTFPPIFLIDRLGRRKVLMLGSSMLCVTMALFIVGVALKTTASSRLALAMLIIYEITFGMSWNSVPWLYAPEITPLNLRHVGAAIGCFSEWLWTFVCGFPHDRGFGASTRLSDHLFKPGHRPNESVGC